MPKKNCIFCQKDGKLSKEHIWPDWYRSYAKPKSTDSYINEIHVGEGKKPSTLIEKIERNGNLITLKLRVVCEKCNNGWMSELENKVKCLLIPIINEKTINIDTKAQRILSEWITMKTLVAEHFQAETIVTLSNDINKFYKTREIPRYFRIYIGKHNNPCQTAYMRHTHTFSSPERVFKQPMYNRQRNTQTILLLFGPLIIYVIACREIDLRIWKFFKLGGLLTIFPTRKNLIKWKKVEVLNQNRLSNIAYSLDDLAKHKKVKYGGRTIPINHNNS